VYDKKEADKKIKELEKSLEPLLREVANRDGTIATQDKELRILRVRI